MTQTAHPLPASASVSQCTGRTSGLLQHQKRPLDGIIGKCRAKPADDAKVKNDHLTTSTQLREQRIAGRRAFTLVEMLIVVLLIAIISAMAVARLGNTSATRLRAAATMLAADLNYAQIESIANAQTPRVVVFDTATSTYHIATTSDLDTPITNPITKAPYTVRFGHGSAAALGDVTIAATDMGGDHRVAFGVYGQIDQATAATITLACDGATVTLTIDPVTGETTIGDIGLN